MKVLQINATYGNGSTGIIVRFISDCVEDAGGESCIVYETIPHNMTIKHEYKIGNLFSNKLHALLSRVSGKQGYFSWLPTFRLLRYIDSISPDVVHLHNLHNNYINLPMLLNFLAKHDIATVVTLHDCWFFTGGCTHYTSTGCTKWTQQCGHCPRRYQDFPAYLCDSSARQLADRRRLFGAIPRLTVVGASEWIAKEASQNVFKGRKCIAIHNGIDTEFFKPTPSDFRKRYHIENKYMIVSLATKWYLPINKESRNRLLQGATEDVVFVLIGGCKQPEEHNNVIHLGFISDRSLLREIFSAADLFVNLTREDTLPTVNMEVQACGTPIVAYDNTGVKETIAPDAGFAVENGNVEMLFDKVMECKAQGKTHIAQKCRDFILSNYNRNTNYQEYVKLYKSIISDE